MLEQVSISFLFHLCRFVRVQFVRIRHFFVRIQLNVCAAIDDCCADIVGILCCVLGSLVSPWWDCFFPVHCADIAVSCAAIVEGCAETLNVLCGNGKFVVSFSFLHVGVGCS